MSDNNLSFDTLALHAGQVPDSETLSRAVPIYQTSTFAFESAEEGERCFLGESSGYIYTRLGNPTIKSLERCIADLCGGFDAVAVSSGMAAVNTIYMALLSKGDHMISTAAVYGPSRGVMEDHWSRFGVESTYVDTTNLENIKKATHEWDKTVRFDLQTKKDELAK